MRSMISRAQRVVMAVGSPYAASAALGLVAFGCAATGTHPHDMSAAEHERAAKHEERTAEQHQEQYDPDAWTAGSGGCSTYCFDTWSNPTSEHAREARRHRAFAAKHRKASQALREAEARSCVGVPERDRDVSPFFHFGDIEKVERVSEGDAAATYFISFTEVSGLDADGMQKLLDCHSARNAVLGHEVGDMDYCPLVPRGVEATVEPRESGLGVCIEVRGETSVAAVRDRVHRLEARLVEP